MQHLVIRTRRKIQIFNHITHHELAAVGQHTELPRLRRGHTGIGQATEPICQGGKNNRADAVGCGGHTADHTALVREKLNGVAVV